MCWPSNHVEKNSIIRKIRLNSKYDITAWLTNSYSTHIAISHEVSTKRQGVCSLVLTNFVRPELGVQYKQVVNFKL